MEVGAPDTSLEDYARAKSRGQTAQKLFDDENSTKKTMKDIIKALRQEDLHAAHPEQYKSGKDDFFKACWDAVAMDMLPQEERTDGDKAAFIADLWKSALASRKAQSTIPCW